MVVEQDLQKLFQNLLKSDDATITVGGSDVLVRIVDQGAAVVLTTPIYSGGNYIPTSVRNSIKTTPPFSSTAIRTDLLLSEENFQVTLRYTGSTDNLNTESFRVLLEEYAWLADEWRLLLDEQDRNDRVHITV